MPTDYMFDSSRLGKDGGSVVTWQASCGNDIINYNKNDKLVVAFDIQGNAKPPQSESHRIQWRNVTQAGSFVDVTSSGQVKSAASAGALVNTTSVDTLSGCNAKAIVNTEEVENESPMETTSFGGADKKSEEYQFCVDLSAGIDSHEYEFQLYSVTGAEAIGVSGTVTLAATATEDYKDIPLKTSIYVLTSKDIGLKVSTDILNYKDIPLKGSVEALDSKNIVVQCSINQFSFLDTPFKVSIESENRFSDVTLKSSLDIQAFKDVALETSIEVINHRDIALKSTVDIPNYMDVGLKVSISIPSYHHMDLKSSIEGIGYHDVYLRASVESNWHFKDIGLKAAVEGLSSKHVSIKGDISVLAFKDIDLKTSIESDAQWNDLPLKTSVTGLGFKDVTLQATIELQRFYKDIGLKVSIETGVFILTVIEDATNVPLKTSIEVLESLNIPIKTTIDILGHKNLSLKVGIEVEQWKDIPLKASIESNPQLRIVPLKATIDVINTADVSLKISIDIVAIYNETEVRNGPWQKTSPLSLLAKCTSLSGIDINACDWILSLDDGTTWGTNAPAYNDATWHLARRELPSYEDDDLIIVFETSISTTDGSDGAAFPIALPEGDLVKIKWRFTDQALNEYEAEFRIRTDTLEPVDIVINSYKSSAKSDAVVDGGWTNDSQLFFEFVWVERRSGMEAFSYSISGVDPDEVEEKDYTDPNYDMENDSDPSN